MKKVMTLLATAFLLVCACALPAQEEAAIKKVIPDALNAIGNFAFEKIWSYWCPDGFIEKNGKKLTIDEMKKSPEYQKVLILGAMKNAKNLEELVDLMVKTGEISQEDKNTFTLLPEENKKEMFNVMQQAIALQQNMLKMALVGTIASLKYKELKIEGDTAVAAISLNGPLAGGGDAVVTFKKVKNVWKIYSIQDVLSNKAGKTGAK